jgi:TrmH family RNA methyltransferase
MKQEELNPPVFLCILYTKTMELTSTSNPKVRWLRSIIDKKKIRQQEGVFVGEGVRLLEEAVRHNYSPKAVFYSEELTPRAYDLVHSLEKMSNEIYKLPEWLFQKVGETQTTQGVVAVFETVTRFPKSPTFVLVLDQLRDPGNAGTLLRSALAMGVDAIIATPGTVELFSPKVVRAGMCVHFSLPLVEMDWSMIASTIKNNDSTPFTILCTVVDGGTPIWESKPAFPLALVIGSEAHGVSKAGLALADQLVTIPMSGKAESLNAAIAGSIAMYEIMRTAQL